MAPWSIAPSVSPLVTSIAHSIGPWSIDLIFPLLIACNIHCSFYCFLFRRLFPDLSLASIHPSFDCVPWSITCTIYAPSIAPTTIACQTLILPLLFDPSITPWSYFRRVLLNVCERVALHGRILGGRSTNCSLIQRLYHPTFVPFILQHSYTLKPDQSLIPSIVTPWSIALTSSSAPSLHLAAPAPIVHTYSSLLPYPLLDKGSIPCKTTKSYIIIIVKYLHLTAPTPYGNVNP